MGTGDPATSEILEGDEIYKRFSEKFNNLNYNKQKEGFAQEAKSKIFELVSYYAATKHNDYKKI